MVFPAARVHGDTDESIVVESAVASGVSQKAAEHGIARFHDELANVMSEGEEELAQDQPAYPGAAESIVELDKHGFVQTGSTGNIRYAAETKLRVTGLDSHLRLDLGAYGSDFRDRLGCSHTTDGGINHISYRCYLGITSRWGASKEASGSERSLRCNAITGGDSMRMRTFAVGVGLVATTLAPAGLTAVADAAPGDAMCHVTANNPHHSKGSPGWIVGKGRISCTADIDSVKVIVKLERKQDGKWVTVGNTGTTVVGLPGRWHGSIRGLSATRVADREGQHVRVW